MDYVINNYESTKINDKPIDLVVRCEDEMGNSHSFTLLQVKNMRKLGNSFIIGNLRLVSLTNLVIENDIIINYQNFSEKTIDDIVDTIKYIQENGWTDFIGDIDYSSNPKLERIKSKNEKLMKSIDLNVLRGAIK